MPAPRKTSRNLFGLGKKQKPKAQECTTKPSKATYGEAMKQAYQAGQQHGNTEHFHVWLCEAGLNQRSSLVRQKLRAEYHRGVKDGQAPKPAKPTSLSSFKGVKLYKLPDGDYTTSIDRDSHFDSLQDAKAFITSWKSNPKHAKTTGTRNPKKTYILTTENNANGAIVDWEVSAESPEKAREQLRKMRPSFTVKKITAKETKANPKTKINNNRGKVGKRRRNPEDEADRAYREFTGHDPSVEMEIEETEHVHKKVWTVGKLICLELILPNGKPKVIIAPGFSEKRSQGKPYWDLDDSLTPGELIWVTANKAYTDEQGNKHDRGTQIFFHGGDQSIDMQELGFEPVDEKEQSFIGTIRVIWYRQKKKFEGPQETDFHHQFGKEGSKGIMPLLCYRARSLKMEVIGGRYQIAEPEGALGGVSPGIIG